MPEDIALFIDFENIRYSMLNIQRREPDPQELIAVGRRYGTVMVARAYADWSRQPEPFKGSLTAAMIDRVDCPAKQRDRIRMGTVHRASDNIPTRGLGAGEPAASSDLGIASTSSSQYQPGWPTRVSGNSDSLPAITPASSKDSWADYQKDAPPSLEDAQGSELLAVEEVASDENTDETDYRDSSSSRQAMPCQDFYEQSQATRPLGYNTGPLASSSAVHHTAHIAHSSAINANSASTIVQSTVVQSTVDLNMLMDIIETVFDRPTISTFVLMTGDKDFTRISARLKLRLNKTVIVVGIPGTVSRDLISSANQFVPLVPNGVSSGTASFPTIDEIGQQSSSGNTGAMADISYRSSDVQTASQGILTIDTLDPQFLQFLDYIDRNWSWRTIIGVSNFIGDAVNPKNRFRGRLTRESARELLHACIQQNILLVHTDVTGAEDLRLNRSHTDVEEVLKQFIR